MRDVVLARAKPPAGMRAAATGAFGVAFGPT